MQLENLSNVRQDVFFFKYVELGSGKSMSSLRIFFLNNRNQFCLVMWWEERKEDHEQENTNICVNGLAKLFKYR